MGTLIKKGISDSSYLWLKTITVIHISRNSYFRLPKKGMSGLPNLRISTVDNAF